MRKTLIVLGWAPNNPVKELARIMMDVDVEAVGLEWWRGGEEGVR